MVQMIEFLKNISPIEWLVVLLVLVILFGRGIVARIGKASGETVHEIKNVKKSFTDAVEGEEKEEKKEEKA